jgi:hypothetical protein
MVDSVLHFTPQLGSVNPGNSALQLPIVHASLLVTRGAAAAAAQL